MSDAHLFQPRGNRVEVVGDGFPLGLLDLLSEILRDLERRQLAREDAGDRFHHFEDQYVLWVRGDDRRNRRLGKLRPVERE